MDNYREIFNLYIKPVIEFCNKYITEQNTIRIIGDNQDLYLAATDNKPDRTIVICNNLKEILEIRKDRSSTVEPFEPFFFDDHMRVLLIWLLQQVVEFEYEEEELAKMESIPMIIRHAPRGEMIEYSIIDPNKPKIPHAIGIADSRMKAMFLLCIDVMNKYVRRLPISLQDPDKAIKHITRVTKQVNKMRNSLKKSMNNAPEIEFLHESDATEDEIFDINDEMASGSSAEDLESVDKDTKKGAFENYLKEDHSDISTNVEFLI